MTTTYATRRALGLCTRCLLPSTASRCDRCADHRAQLTRVVADAHRAERRCLRCPAPAAEGGSLCDGHRAEDRAAGKLRAEARESSGRCVRCGGGRRRPGTRCGRCASRDSQRQRQRREA